MKRILPCAFLLLAAICASAADGFARDPAQTSLATTGRIVRIDFKNKTLKMRGADNQNQSIFSISQMMQALRQRIGFTLPGGISIGLPGRNNDKNSQKSAADAKYPLDEYTVVVTDDTIFQDGGDYIRFEDFKAGETISIHGVLRGSTLTATRIAKWS